LGVREICTKYGVMMIVDEVITGGYVPMGAVDPIGWTGIGAT
jgi:glutamate-1-semialdehyde aminotransferase